MKKKIVDIEITPSKEKYKQDWTITYDDNSVEKYFGVYPTGIDFGEAKDNQGKTIVIKYAGDIKDLDVDDEVIE